MKMVEIKDGYISYTTTQGLQSSEHFGGFVLVSGKPSQVKFTKSEMLKKVKKLSEDGCEVRTVEICTYEVENSQYAELIDPVE